MHIPPISKETAAPIFLWVLLSYCIVAGVSYLCYILFDEELQAFLGSLFFSRAKDSAKWTLQLKNYGREKGAYGIILH